MTNMFPVSYQPAQYTYPYSHPQMNYQQQPNFQQPVPQTPQNQPIMQPAGSNMIFVDGEEIADKWVLEKGQTIVLFDQNKDVFYVKSVNENGMPMPLEVCTFKRSARGKEGDEANEAEKEQAAFEPSMYVTVDEFERRISELNKTVFKLMSSVEGKDAKGAEDEKRILL